VAATDFVAWFDDPVREALVVALAVKMSQEGIGTLHQKPRPCPQQQRPFAAPRFTSFGIGDAAVAVQTAVDPAGAEACTAGVPPTGAVIVASIVKPLPDT